MSPGRRQPTQRLRKKNNLIKETKKYVPMPTMAIGSTPFPEDSDAADTEESEELWRVASSVISLPEAP